MILAPPGSLPPRRRHSYELGARRAMDCAIDTASAHKIAFAALTIIQCQRDDIGFDGLSLTSIDLPACTKAGSERVRQRLAIHQSLHFGRRSALTAAHAHPRTHCNAALRDPT